MKTTKQSWKETDCNLKTLLTQSPRGARENKLESHIQSQIKIWTTTLQNETHHYYIIHSLRYKHKVHSISYVTQQPPHQKTNIHEFTTKLSMHICGFHSNGKRNIQHMQSPLSWKYEKTEERCVKNKQESPQPSSTLIKI